MKIAIVGLGLIGGSMALDLKKTGFANQVVGVDHETKHANRALELGLVSEMMPLDQAIAACEVVILAIPVQSIASLLPQVMDQVESQSVIEVGSTKQQVIKSIENHPKRARFLSTHPMAGTEFSGPDAAVTDLFQDKTVIFCDSDRSSQQTVSVISKLYEALGMRIIHMDAVSHDLHAAYVSHISHISSFALALTVLQKEKDETNIFNLASGGFDSTVRLAKSASSMWTPIFQQNAENILNVLDTYIQELYRFRKAIETQDPTSIDLLISKANEIKKILK